MSTAYYQQAIPWGQAPGNVCHESRFSFPVQTANAKAAVQNNPQFSSTANNNRFYFINAGNNYTLNQYHGALQSTSFENGASTYCQNARATRHDDETQQAIRASLNDEALRLSRASGSAPDHGESRRGQRAGSRVTNSCNHALSSTMSCDTQSEFADIDRSSPQAQDAPSFSIAPSSPRPTTPPPAYTSLPLQSTNILPRPRTAALPAEYEAPSFYPPHNLPSAVENKPLLASETAFPPRKPLSFHSFKKKTFLLGPQAKREYEKELEWRERHCRVEGCKDKRTHRTIEIQKKSEEMGGRLGWLSPQGTKKGRAEDRVDLLRAPYM